MIIICVEMAANVNRLEIWVKHINDKGRHTLSSEGDLLIKVHLPLID